MYRELFESSTETSDCNTAAGSDHRVLDQASISLEHVDNIACQRWYGYHLI